MKNIFFLAVLLFITSRASFADFGDTIAKAIFQKKVDQVYEKALLCTPLERDAKSSMNITDWIKVQPTLPSWQMLAEIETTAKEARDYARKTSANDKIRHCLAGCYVAKKLDRPSAVLVGWFKELNDASDCSKNTSFEKKDFDATVFGARAGNSEKKCEIFCKN